MGEAILALKFGCLVCSECMFRYLFFFSFFPSDRPHGYPGKSSELEDHWIMLVCFLYAVLFVSACAFALIAWKFQKNRNEAWDCEQKIEWDTEVDKEEEGGEEGGGEGMEAGGLFICPENKIGI